MTAAEMPMYEVPEYSLERRESSGQLVWRKDSPSSKVRFRFEVDVLEFEKEPHEDLMEADDEGFMISNASPTVAICATCVAVVAVCLFFPWYMMERAGTV